MADSDIDTIYQAYKVKPSPDSLHSVVSALEPTIQFTLGSMNAANDPVVRSKAMLHTADAVEKFDPKVGASLPTFVSAQLRQLSRDVRVSRSPVKLPERIQLDALKLNQAKARFQDERGREPDLLELADFTGVPVKRIEKVQRYQFSIPSESQVGDLAKEGPDFEKEALDYIYHDSDHTDRRILELKTGYGGTPPMDPKDIAVKLNLTPSQLSRRSARLSMRIQNIHSALTKV